MTVYIALLRGINVGGKNKLPMADLRKCFVDAGCNDVQTYIQSGNVVFRASEKLAKGISATVVKMISKRFGLEVPVITRSAKELRTLEGSNPFLPSQEDPTKLHVVFLADEPIKENLAKLDAHRSPPDEFVVRGREVFLHCPNGIARTKLTNAYFDSKLETTSTVRNWKTVLKLIQIAGEL